MVSHKSNFLLWLAGICTLVRQIFAVNDGFNHFIEPPSPGSVGDFTQNNIYVAGSQINVRWETNFTELSLALYQNDNSTFMYLPDMKFVSTRKSTRWTADLANFDLAQGEVFFFVVFAEDGSERQISSHYFNLSKNGIDTPSRSSLPYSSSTPAPSFPSAISTASSTTSAAASSSILSSTATTTDPNPTSTLSPVQPPSSATQTSAAENTTGTLTTGAKAGIGVGVGVGAVGLVAVFVGIYMVRRARPSKSNHKAATGTSLELSAPGVGPSPMASPYISSSHITSQAPPLSLGSSNGGYQAPMYKQPEAALPRHELPQCKDPHELA